MLARLLGRPAAVASPPPPRRPGRVSVVIPLYNHARFVADALSSAITQQPQAAAAGTDLLDEIIVVDDSSTDDGASVVAALAANEPRIVLWSQPNRGAAAAINAGLLRARGEFVAVLNSDDRWMPDRLARLAGALDADPGAWLATSDILFVDASGREIPNEWHREAMRFGAGCPDPGTALCNANLLVSTSNFMIRRDALDRVGLFANLRYAHDLDFALRLLLAGGRIASVPERLLAYRTHETNTIAEDHRGVRVEWAMAAGAYLEGVLRAGEGPAGWRRSTALIEVLRRHEILAGATLCAAELRRSGHATLERAPLAADPAFRDMLGAVVG